jgi:hypothetical protein
MACPCILCYSVLVFVVYSEKDIIFRTVLPFVGCLWSRLFNGPNLIFVCPKTGVQETSKSKLRFIID